MSKIKCIVGKQIVVKLLNYDMDCGHEVVESLTPATIHENDRFWKTEDSGYHTSYTPGSLECSELSNENCYPSFSKRIRLISHRSVDSNETTSEGIIRLSRRGRRHKCPSVNTLGNSITESPIKRRGVKRSYQEDPDVSCTSVPTPTSIIAGGIQRLKVDSLSPASSEFSESFSRHLYTLENSTCTISYPTTPVKKICRSNDKPSPSSFNDSQNSSPLRTINNLSCPPRRSAKKLNFFHHSLSGETQKVPATKLKPQSKVVRTIFRPEQKVDLIKMLYNVKPAINKILSYLSNEDIYNFSLVSPVWLQVCEDNAKSKKKEYVEFITNTKENHENRSKCKANETAGKSENKQKVLGFSLSDIQNIINSRSVKKSPLKSPPTTPRTRRFKTFTKSASLDNRTQLSCVRCRQPAKVTEEPTGEEWAACSSKTCSYQFCRFCKSDRHPNKTCFRYDLDGPSPSKRKKKTTVVGTKKSKRNLRRLLD